MKTMIDEQASFAYDQKGIMNNEQKDLEKSEVVQTNKEQVIDVSAEIAAPSEQPAHPNLEAEYQEAIAQEIARRSKKIVATKLSDDLMKRFEQAIALLQELEHEVEQKQSQALEKNNQIKEIVLQLMQAGYIQVNEEEFKRSEESVQEYVRLLDDVKREISEEMSRVITVRDAQEGKEFTVWKTSPDLYQDYVEHRIKQVKHYIKSVKRDLMISYSRYCYGFDAQMKRIEAIQRFVSRTQKQKNSASEE